MDPRVLYLAKVCDSTRAYWQETQATITDDGSRVIQATNWNENEGDVGKPVGNPFHLLRRARVPYPHSMIPAPRYNPQAVPAEGNRVNTVGMPTKS